MANDAPLAFRATYGGIWVTTSSAWQLVFGFAANIVLTRLLVPEAFGEFALAMFFAHLIAIHQKIGLSSSFVQLRDSSEKAMGTFFVVEVLAVCGGVILLIPLVYVLPYLGYTAHMTNVCIALFISLAIEGIGAIGFVLLEKELFLRDASLLRAITFPLSYVPAFWGALNGFGVWSIVFQNITNSLLLLAGSYLMVRHRLPYVFPLKWIFDVPLALKYLRFGIMVGAAATAGMLFMKLDNFYVGTFVGIAALGFYDRAYNTAQWPGTFSSIVLARSVFFVYSQLQDDVDRLTKAASMVTWLLTSFSFPLGLAMFIAAPDMIVLLYGETWLPSAHLLRILVVYTTLRPLHENAVKLLMAVGKPQITTKFYGLQLALLIILGLPFTLMWGAVGTGLAVVAAFLPGLFMAYYSVARFISFRPYSAFFLPILASAITATGYFYLNQSASLHQLSIAWRLVVKCGYAFTGCLLLLYLFEPGPVHRRISYIISLLR